MIFGLLIAALLAPPALDEAQVVRALKQAERLAYEEHDPAPLLARLAPDVRWINGRRGSAGPHDVVLDLQTLRAILKLDLAGLPADGRLDFAKTSANLDADPPSVEFVETRKFHGGRSLIGVRFTLQVAVKGWRIAERRQWDIEEKVGIIPTLFNDEYWLDADAVIDQPGTDSADERLDALLAARRYSELRDLATRLVAQPSPKAEWWSFLARAEFRLGRLEAARRAARKAHAAGSIMRVPGSLLEGK